MRSLSSYFLNEFYDRYPRIEAAFQTALDESLHPRGPEMLYDVVRDLGLPTGASVIDLGCGEGRHTVELATRFGVAVRGVDPVPRHIELSRERLERAAEQQPELRSLVRFELGTADAIPAGDATVDLIWCREVLYHVENLEGAFAECRRVLRDGGHMLIHQMFAGDLLEPREAERMWSRHGVVPANADPMRVEAAFATAGFAVARRIELGSEWGEYAQETSGQGGRRLVHAARLLRAPERYIAQFGRDAYDLMLADCLWHVFRMIGKLNGRVYLLRKKAPAQV